MRSNTRVGGPVKKLLVAAVLLFGLGCSNVDLDLEVTPTPEVLRVTLGGKEPDTWESLQAERSELAVEGLDILDRLQDSGYGISTRDDEKSRPWPIQTQVSKIVKDIGRIEADLLLMDSPTPTITPIPTITLTPTIDECRDFLHETAYNEVLPTVRALKRTNADVHLGGIMQAVLADRTPGELWKKVYGEQRASCQDRLLQNLYN